MNQNFLKEDLLQDSQTDRISFVGLRSGSSAFCLPFADVVLLALLAVGLWNGCDEK